MTAPPRLRPLLLPLVVAVLLAVPAPAWSASGQVAALQVALRAERLDTGPVDGVAGPATAAGVRALQARRGLAVDGVAGARTRRALGRRGRPGYGARTMTSGDQGWDVAALQFELAAHGFPSGSVDGGFGARTAAALRRFQAWAGLAPDGAAGPGTRAALARPVPRSPLRFVPPVAARLGDRFGPRGDRLHSGVDYEAPQGLRVGAAGRGCVRFAGWDAGGYGNLVVIAHRAGMTSWYAHLDTIAVRPGQCVPATWRIGTVGATGRAFGPHLHFELRLRGAVIDPLTGL
jgi:peptidoglycan hydrolase-like protein with peptidoglycan-binding domain